MVGIRLRICNKTKCIGIKPATDTHKNKTLETPTQWRPKGPQPGSPTCLRKSTQNEHLPLKHGWIINGFGLLWMAACNVTFCTGPPALGLEQFLRAFHPNSSPKAALATKSQHLHPQGTNMTQPVTLRFPIVRESKLHKILRLPRNMGADLHQMLRLPRKVNICSINART